MRLSCLRQIEQREDREETRDKLTERRKQQEAREWTRECRDKVRKRKLAIV